MGAGLGVQPQLEEGRCPFPHGRSIGTQAQISELSAFPRDLLWSLHPDEVAKAATPALFQMG